MMVHYELKDNPSKKSLPNQSTPMDTISALLCCSSLEMAGKYYLMYLYLFAWSWSFLFSEKKKRGHIFKSDFIIKLKWFQERSSEPSHFSKSFQIWFSILKGILCRFNQFLNRRKPSGKVWGICTEVIYGGRSDVNLHLTFFPEKERCHRQER